jgi:hypothetical protein
MKIDDVVILEQASWDIEEGKSFYRANSAKVGDYFFDSIISDIESLYFHAGIHSKHFGLYRMLSKRFPFAIYYDVMESTAVVIAVLDTRRNPAWIRRKLNE